MSIVCYINSFTITGLDYCHTSLLVVFNGIIISYITIL